LTARVVGCQAARWGGVSRCAAPRTVSQRSAFSGPERPQRQADQPARRLILVRLVSGRQLHKGDARSGAPGDTLLRRDGIDKIQFPARAAIAVRSITEPEAPIADAEVLSNCTFDREVFVLLTESHSICRRVVSKMRPANSLACVPLAVSRIWSGSGRCRTHRRQH
jgi:hypothetical protein